MDFETKNIEMGLHVKAIQNLLLAVFSLPFGAGATTEGSQLKCILTSDGPTISKSNTTKSELIEIIESENLKSIVIETVNVDELLQNPEKIEKYKKSMAPWTEATQ